MPPAEAQQEKRGNPSATPETARRPNKRGKYTPVACDECKKRKLKCLPVEDSPSCQRCADVGTACTYTASTRDSGNTHKDRGKQADTRAVSDEVKDLRRLVGDLVGTVGELKTQLNQQIVFSPSRPDHISVDSQSARINEAPSIRGSRHLPAQDVSAPSPLESSPQHIGVPKQPQFVGPTRSAFSIAIGEEALTQRGIPEFDPPPPSGVQSPVGSPKQGPTTLDAAFWQRCGTDEIVRLITVFQEEVESVYPCTDTDYLAGAASDIVTWGRAPEDADPSTLTPLQTLTFKDFQIAKVAIATAIVIEAHGKTENSTMMVDSVERNVSRILKPASDLKDLQLLTILASHTVSSLAIVPLKLTFLGQSIYYFHSDEDLLAWRTIGLAAREALVMGLHRKPTVLKTFPDDAQRSVATRVFWCIYVLDRRWSFGTSLSFALQDRDIDPELPEPGPQLEYLKCMIGYGRLCSKLWEALMSFGSIANYIPSDTATSLDIQTQEWLESIPSHLQLRHPRLGLAARAQPRVLQRLRALLYLRGNHTRILIFRHHLLNPDRIKSDPDRAWLVVEIAQDSIQVLVHLNATSDIYRRQQSAFNYFLLSALAVIFLAVCHEPNMFGEPCRKSFHAAVKLVKDFSRHSLVSRRLWNSIKGLLPRLRQLGIHGTEEGRESDSTDSGRNVNSTRTRTLMNRDNINPESAHVPQGLVNNAPDEATMIIPYQAPLQDGISLPALTTGDTEAMNDDLTFMPESSETTPNLYEMSNDLMALFDAFEQGQQLNMDQEFFSDNLGSAPDAIIGVDGEVARRFQWLF